MVSWKLLRSGKSDRGENHHRLFRRLLRLHSSFSPHSPLDALIPRKMNQLFQYDLYRSFIVFSTLMCYRNSILKKFKYPSVYCKRPSTLLNTLQTTAKVPLHSWKPSKLRQKSLYIPEHAPNYCKSPSTFLNTLQTTAKVPLHSWTPSKLLQKSFHITEHPPNYCKSPSTLLNTLQTTAKALNITVHTLYNLNSGKSLMFTIISIICLLAVSNLFIIAS